MTPHSLHVSTSEAIKPVLPAASRGNVVSVAAEIAPFCADCLVGNAVLRNRCPAAKFPANREKDREYSQNGGFFAQNPGQNAMECNGLEGGCTTQQNRELNDRTGKLNRLKREYSDRKGILEICQTSNEALPNTAACGYHTWNATWGPVTRTEFGGAKLEVPDEVLAAVRSPRPERLVSEDAERAAGCGMALDVDGVLDGGVNGQEAWADPGDLKRCILRSRRRLGWCEFSARLFLRKPCSWRADNPISDFAAP